MKLARSPRSWSSRFNVFFPQTKGRTCLHTQGFTLLEILIAVTAFAIVLAAINAVFYGAVRLRNKTAESVDSGLLMQQALVIMKRDLANLLPPGGTFAGELQSTPTAGSLQSSANVTSFNNADKAAQISPDIYTTTGTVDEFSPWADIQKVAYLLVDSTNRTVGKDLIRSVTRNLLPPTVEEPPVYQWLMGGIQEVAFYYYDGSQWRDSWDSTAEETKLPTAIKVQISLAVEDRRQPQFPPVELVVPLMVQARTNSTEQASGGGQ
jgi:type II secretion system protein J